ncbi:hypothetical protein ENE74_14355 [Sphingobium algorifonticola]|uniref:Outer membrane protein beta-barrel domain-containing protein n=2 Tax=Sphingobium algorifonticola TaxID=2008318 RepID=A0A437J5E7_9SPHN|nr:hypothetical protein ENE74_14355 [Sphingobium algorifonticola]
MKRSVFRSRLRMAAAVLSAGVALPLPLFAQTVPDTLFQEQDRDLLARGDDRFTLPVPERFQPEGIRAGAFLISPDLALDGLFDSNVFARDDARNDVSLIAAPRLRIRSLSQSYTLDSYVSAQVDRHDRFKTENVESIAAGMLLRKPFGNSLVTSLRIEGGTFVEDRAAQLATNDNLTPVEYDRVSGRASASILAGRLVVNGWFGLDRRAYRNTLRRSDPTQVFIQTDRDVTQYNPALEVGYTLAPSTLLYGGFEYNKRDFDFTPPPGSLLPSRDSDGYVVYGGARFQPSALTRLDFALGYQRQNYLAPFADPSGLYVRASFDWTPLRTVLVRIDGERSISETGALLLGGSTRTRIRGNAEYEVLRNLRLGFRAEYLNIDTAALPQNDRRISGGATAEYRFNPNVSLRLRGDLLVSRPGQIILEDFERARLSAGLQFRL